MNTSKWARFTLALALALLGGMALWATLTQAAPGRAPLAQGGAPTVVAYQGQVVVSGAPYSGTAHFKFAVVNPAGTTTYWSNDGTSTGGGEPTSAVQLAVSEGLFSVLLGDTALGGMTQALTMCAFDEPDSYLRVWFSDDGSTFSQLTPDTRIAAVPYALQAQEAADADTVDGLHASELGTHYQNVVIVAKSGGDYTSVQAAIDSIGDAAAGDPYLVWVAPGVYVEEVTMKPYVHLQGAGQEATVISLTTYLTSHVSLRDLTVGGNGTSTALRATDGTTDTLVADVTARALSTLSYNRAVYLSGSGTHITLQNVTALAENGDYNYGLHSIFSATVTLHGGSFTARGGDDAYGIYLQEGYTTILKATGITALAENANDKNRALFSYYAGAALYGSSFLAQGSGSENVGLYNYHGDITLHGGSFTAREGSNAYGVYNHYWAILEAQSITALAENGTHNYGLRNYHGADATLRGGSFTARGGNNAAGIYNGYVASLDTESVIALGEDSGLDTQGLYNCNGAGATLRGGSFIARGGSNAYGIYNDGFSLSPTIDSIGITALGENGSSNNFGLYNLSHADLDADSSQFTGGDYGLYQTNGTVRLGVTQLDGGAYRSSGTLTCFQVYDANYASYTCP